MIGPIKISNVLSNYFDCEPFVAIAKKHTKGPIYIPSINLDKLEAYSPARNQFAANSDTPDISQLNKNIMSYKNFYTDYINRNINDINLCACLGQLSDCNLCVIDLDDSSFRKEFLLLNPILLDSLIIKANRIQVWIKVKDFIPPCYLYIDNKHVGEFRSTGWFSIFFGNHPNTNKYIKFNNCKPKNIYFDEIKWPDNLFFSRFHHSGKTFPINLLNKTKSYHHKFVIEYKDLDCEISDYSHFALCYFEDDKNIFRYDVDKSELEKQKKQDGIHINRYFDLPIKPTLLIIEPFSTIKSFRPRIKISIDDSNCENKKFSLNEQLMANWHFS